jgi:hypothetical protein
MKKKLRYPFAVIYTALFWEKEVSVKILCYL